MYWEDILLSRRVQQAGWPLKFASSVQVKHSENQQAPTGKHLYYLVRNGALFLEQETAWPTRSSWWVLNRLRRIYHHARRTPVVSKALDDATHGVTAQRA